jgi:hypothetical protein
MWDLAKQQHHLRWWSVRGSDKALRQWSGAPAGCEVDQRLASYPRCQPPYRGGEGRLILSNLDVGGFGWVSRILLGLQRAALYRPSSVGLLARPSYFTQMCLIPWHLAQQRHYRACLALANACGSSRAGKISRQANHTDSDTVVNCGS